MSQLANNHASHHVRPATKHDIAEVCKMERSATARFKVIPELAFLVDSDVLSAEKVEYWLEAGRIWIFEDDQQQPIGFIAAHQMDTAVYIAEVSVLADQNGKGAGSALIETVKQWARQRALEGTASGGSNVARVSLTTYPDVPWNGPFYRKRGFVEVPADTIGPKHTAKMTTDEEERSLVQPGYRRCCMLWEDK